MNVNYPVKREMDHQYAVMEKSVENRDTEALCCSSLTRKNRDWRQEIKLVVA